MKRIISIAAAAVMILLMVSCGEKAPADDTEETGCDTALIAASDSFSEGRISSAAWSSVQKHAEENGLEPGLYRAEDCSAEAVEKSVREAADDGAGFMIMAGSEFETAMYHVQKEFPDISFLMLDGVPHDKKDRYTSAPNTVSVVFAEEEAGFLAGSAAVRDGCTRLGFIGGKKTPEVRRYGFGFVQGAASAAGELKKKVEIRYRYTGTQDGKDTAAETASEWFGRDTQVIFTSDDELSLAVIGAAGSSGGKVIGADTDQNGMSEAVMTSSVKGIDEAVAKVMKSYAGRTFKGGTAFNYGIGDKGVMLEMEGSRFSRFTQEEYENICERLCGQEMELKKDTVVNSVKDLATDWVTVIV